jgi:hypothetical protein
MSGDIANDLVVRVWRRRDASSRSYSLLDRMPPSRFAATLALVFVCLGAASSSTRSPGRSTVPASTC